MKGGISSGFDDFGLEETAAGTLQEIKPNGTVFAREAAVKPLSNRATQAFSAALAAGFRILRILVAVLGTVFLFSNIYWVPEGVVALQCRMGMLVGETLGTAVRRPGGPYFAFPYPIDTVFRYPTTMQQVSVDNAFWVEGSESAASNDTAVRGESLQPGVHGSLITGDKNLVQGKWIVRFTLDYSARLPVSDRQVLSFARTIGNMEEARGLVRVLAEEAIVAAVAATPVADFVAGRVDHEQVRRTIQVKVDTLGTGLKISGVSASTYQPPFTLAGDFHAVTKAESEKALQIEKAVRYRISTLSEAAGEHWETLLEKINAYELTQAGEDADLRESAIEQIEILMKSGTLGGEVAQLLDQARTDKTRTIERARARASRFNELLEANLRDPAVLKETLRQEALRHLFMDPSSSVRFVPPGARLYLNADADPIE